LTLRDAQHLCWKTFKKIELRSQKASQASDTTDNLVQKAEQISQKTLNSAVSVDKANVAKLLSELVYLTFILAEQHGVNLEEDFLQTIDELILGSMS
jgi:phosphoribosyl-ATP pyrophosphohydrolase